MKIITHTIFTLITFISVICIGKMHAQSVKSIYPTSGSLNGQTKVVIKGSGFTSKKLESVIFGAVGIPVTTNNVKSDSIIEVLTPAVNKAQSVNVEVVFNGLTCENKPFFNYEKPVITSFFPISTSTKGKEVITIKGKYFSGASYVKFGKAGNTPLKVTDTLITVKNPPHIEGEVEVAVEVQTNLGVAPSMFGYWNKPPLNTYNLKLESLIGLGSDYKVYVLGYSTGSQKILTPNKKKQGVFTKVTEKTGYVKSYELGTDITSIELSNLNPIVGARIYFFVANTTKTYKDNSGKTGNGNLGFSYSGYGSAVQQVGNPPQSDFPQYSYIEPTFESGQGLFIDVSLVDGFFFPLSLLAEDKKGNELGRVGQTEGISAEEVSNAYKPFMKKYKNSSGYDDLSYKADKNLTVLLNPGLYLAKNTSSLETVFDDALKSLFMDKTLNMNIWQKDKDGTPYYFNVKPKLGVTFPGTTNTHDALEFTAPGLSESLYVFNPKGFSVVSYEDTQTKKRLPIKGTIANSILTFNTPLPSSVGILKGMYVSNASCKPNTSVTISKVNTNTSGEIVSVNIDTGSKCASTSKQFKFSKAPKNYYQSSGQMTFAGSGLFADGGIRYPNNANLQVILNGLENQLSTALNRGVAITKAVGTEKGRTTTLWGKETSWYPSGTTQNLFSYFMHTATVKGKNIFSLPANAAKSARGAKMAQAYGFSYDENPIEFKRTNQPPVPSEFTGTYPNGTTQLKLVLGPWKTKKTNK
ncbi:IPT/TIG domain-containing protein [Tenacibaculum sp. 190524A05c]|uniref:IPT/TIG domain-containing protein n=1 Tax=Tenacibaculum platacis TaxID=3137852 RepID=UPI0032B279CC